MIENRHGCGQWCRGNCSAPRGGRRNCHSWVGRVTPRCEVLRTRRQHHAKTSHSWQASTQSQSWPSPQGSKCWHCASAELVGSHVFTDGLRPRRVLHLWRWVLRHSQTQTVEEIEIHRRGEVWHWRRVCASFEQAGETVRPSDQNESLQPLEDESNRIPPRRLDRIQEDIVATCGRGIPPMMAPNMPTPEERTRHEVDHRPYVAWCRNCVVGKGKN